LKERGDTFHKIDQQYRISEYNRLLAYPYHLRKNEKNFLYNEPLNNIEGMTGDLFLTSDEKKNSYILVFLTADKMVIKKSKEYYELSKSLFIMIISGVNQNRGSKR
jgi:hypothetical protein